MSFYKGAIDAALKFLAGIAVYFFIILVARNDPRAAGIMLTFPTFNGVVLALSDREKIPTAAETMVLLPPINGLLCATYIFIYLIFGRSSESAALLLLVLIGCIWLLVGAPLIVKKIGIPKEWQLIYFGVLSISFTVASMTILHCTGSVEVSPNVDTTCVDYLREKQFQIFLFVACLTGIIALIDFVGLPERWLGVIGGFPPIAFFGVYTVATAEATRGVSANADLLKSMSSTVLLGPIIAVVFIFFVSRFFEARPNLYRVKSDWWKRGLFVICGWGVCYLAIVGMTRLIRLFVNP